MTEPFNFPQAAGLIIAILSSFAISCIVDKTKLFAWFSAPLFARHDETGDPEKIRSVWSGFYLTIGTYFICAAIIAFSGGTIGVIVQPKDQNLDTLHSSSPDTPASNEASTSPPTQQAASITSDKAPNFDQPQETGRNLLVYLSWAFPMGLIGVSLARLTAVFVSTTLVGYLQFLLSFTFGAAIYLLVANPSSVRDWLWFALLNQESRFQFVSFAATQTAIVCITTEVVIWFGARRIGIPYNLLTERIQAFSRITQIFKPHDVIEVTNSELCRIVRTEGLNELLWVTHMAPPHLVKVVEELSKRPNYDEKKAKERLIEVTKVIITSKERPAGLVSILPDENIIRIDETTRVRYLIINGAHLFVHLPLPFLESTGEVSNCLHIISSRAIVSMWRGKFQDFWDTCRLLSHPS